MRLYKLNGKAIWIGNKTKGENENAQEIKVFGFCRGFACMLNSPCGWRLQY
jgi:hypothetical protein